MDAVDWALIVVFAVVPYVLLYREDARRKRLLKDWRNGA